MNTRFYHLAIAVVRPFLSLLYPMRITGLENIPPEGGFILCANHVSALDPIFLAMSVRNRHIHFMGKTELFKNRMFAAVLRALGSFPVDRGHNDLNAVRTALKIVSEGHGLGIFPQGTRSRTNERLPMLSGVALIAVRAGKPVIPVFIDGSYRLFRSTRIVIGAPTDISDFGRKMDSATLEGITRAIENSVWDLQPADDR